MRYGQTVNYLRIYLFFQNSNLKNRATSVQPKPIRFSTTMSARFSRHIVALLFLDRRIITVIQNLSKN